MSALLAACTAPGATGEPGVLYAAGATSPTPAGQATPTPRGPSATPPLPTAASTATATATPANPPTPTPTATEAAECTQRRGRVSQIAVPSGTLRYDIDAQLYLPPCYAQSDMRYPVVYLMHGLGFTEDQWVRLGITRAADELIAAGEIPPLIIVMPRDRHDARQDPAFATDLVAYIDAQYRTLAEGPYRAIGGLSRGAGWAVHLGLHYPEVFGRIGLHSPAVFYGDENSLLAWGRAIDKNGPVPAIYIDIGEGDGQRQSAYWLDQVLTWFDWGHTYVVQPGGHSENYWSAHVSDYLRFYTADWGPTPAPSPTPRDVTE